MKLVVGALIVFALVCSAQSPAELFEKAPPDVDQALRERIGKFYQAHVDRRLRAADDVVAEDSKDMFFVIQKPAFISWEIARIIYSDNFTKAKAIVAVEIDWATPRLGKMRVKQPLTSLWKMEDGQWYWYMEQSKNWESPFGTMTAGPESGTTRLGGFKGVKIEDVLSQVKLEPVEVQLRGYEPSSAEAVVTNRMPGNITVHLQYTGFKGLDMKIDKTELKPGEQARIAISLNPADKSPKPTITAHVRVEPTNQVLPLKVTFAVQPELQKQLPQAPRQ